MNKTVILRSDMDHVARHVLPSFLPTARIGIMRGIWQSWQKYWEVIGTYRDTERINAYAETVEAGTRVKEALIELFRATDRLNNIEAIVESDRDEFREKSEERKMRHQVVMQNLRAEDAEARKRISDASANVSMNLNEITESAKMKMAEGIRLTKEYSEQLREIDSYTNLPEGLKEEMKKLLKDIYEEARKEITGGK